MAKDQSFDVVSQVDVHEVDNAVRQAQKEIVQRYDLKDSGSSIDLDKSAPSVSIVAPSDFIAKQVRDVLDSKLVKRSVDLASLSWGSPQPISGGKVKVSAAIINGIDPDIAKRVNKDIRDQKFKVKVQIEGDKLRVSGPKRDDLQAVIGFLKEQDYGIPLQYTNYR